ncbi:hypothetical protein LAZ67_21000167 [Cordylochernes scorpioides]|uniref:Carboxylesterase type B domain-containing protein n=1 Tax=Cordylochernes scorpioides TaxID=51811 RepID=A0ABY6LPZ4_9ARAC|nr:hypothetical protein LAZ67_21000167 [Cordylochernes scorpioides]
MVAIAIDDGQAEDGKKDPGDKEYKLLEGGSEPKPRWATWKRVLFGVVLVLFIVVAISLAGYFGNGRGDWFREITEPETLIDCGAIRGAKEGDVFTFRGIPYALPPVGERRWKPPTPVSQLEDCWTGTLMALSDKKSCMQKPIHGHPNVTFDEDCLYVNVYTPTLSPLRKKPVVVYIPGDSLLGLGAPDFAWRPSPQLAHERDAVIVTLGYRTNIFGFLALDVLSRSVHPPTSGNYGLYDILAALKWVQKNIPHFGGNPERVTVLAHGSGATAALMLASSHKSHGLISQLWLSGPSVFVSERKAEDVFKDNLVVLQLLNCTSLECLQQKEAADLLTAIPHHWEETPSLQLPDSEEVPPAALAFVDGNMAAETGVSEASATGDRWNWTEFMSYVTERLDTLDANLTESALSLYMSNTSTPLHQFHTMVSDLRSICPVQKLLSLHNHSLADIYSYVSDFVPSQPILLAEDLAPVKMPVHGLDILAIFGLLDSYIPTLADSDRQYQRSMQEIFFNFAHHGRPHTDAYALVPHPQVNLFGSSSPVSKPAPYDHCPLWFNSGLYPRYAKMN